MDAALSAVLKACQTFDLGNLTHDGFKPEKLFRALKETFLNNIGEEDFNEENEKIFYNHVAVVLTAVACRGTSLHKIYASRDQNYGSTILHILGLFGIIEHPGSLKSTDLTVSRFCALFPDLQVICRYIVISTSARENPINIMRGLPKRSKGIFMFPGVLAAMHVGSQYIVMYICALFQSFFRQIALSHVINDGTNPSQNWKYVLIASRSRVRGDADKDRMYIEAKVGSPEEEGFQMAMHDMHLLFCSADWKARFIALWELCGLPGTKITAFFKVFYIDLPAEIKKSIADETSASELHEAFKLPKSIPYDF